MSKVDEAKEILRAIDFPPKLQDSNVCIYSLLALANIKENSDWSEASNGWIRIHDLMIFIKDFYNKEYAENSRETFRKTAMHNFRNAALIEDNGEATNSSRYKYRITDEFLNVITHFRKKDWINHVNQFLSIHESLVELYASKKEREKYPVNINGKIMSLSSGSHNMLQKLILEDFAPRFAPNSYCLYLGDSTERNLYVDNNTLESLNIKISVHDKLPDIILYRKEDEWLYLIEAVTSVGPMSPKRLKEIKEMLKDSNAKPIFVTAFLDFTTFKRFAENIAWDTEIWIADFADHMIHMNGDRFIGPR